MPIDKTLVVLRKRFTMAERKLVSIDADGETFFVEMLPSEVSGAQSHEGGKKRRKSEAEDNVRSPAQAAVVVPENAYGSLQTMLGKLSTGVKGAVDASMPSELVIEAKIAFGGKAQPIPFLVSAASDASLTVKVTWKK
jgi:hypothetical protein